MKRLSYVWIRAEEGNTLYHGRILNNDVLELAPEEVLMAESHHLRASAGKYVSLYHELAGKFSAPVSIL